ncbi:hypothetical protein [Jannaschia sp. W003]|uniref:hypothetical protein n=1 Tax=Jannaschia sp. W003 TaxID=2867012 RepID=UPI0021A39B68|nr:hypothetical protein [Jannaschia sp. W003]UWQ20688.1 hypothetical protein K3554_11940 [Jannaschia sp. W003]
MRRNEGQELHMADEADLEREAARLERALAALEAATRPPAEDLGSALAEARGAADAARSEADAARSEAETARAAQAEAEAARGEAEAAREAAEARLRELEARAPESAAEPADPEETARMRAAIEALTASAQQLREQQGGAADASLRAELDALRAARAMDLAEMRAILSELEPMMEARSA